MVMPRHILSALIILEIMSLTLILIIIYNYSLIANNNIELFLIVVTLRVCEARIRLGILVCLIQSWGKDKTSMLSLLSIYTEWQNSAIDLGSINGPPSVEL